MSKAPKTRPDDVLTLALAFYRSPIRYQKRLQTQELPQGMETLLRLAAAHSAVEAPATPTVGMDELRKAALFFIEQVCFAQNADYYRILGLNPRAGEDQIKEHHRLLMGLFHPDRQPTRGTWTEVYAGRINQAYNVLRNRQLRRTYDASLRTPYRKTSTELSSAARQIQGRLPHRCQTHARRYAFPAWLRCLPWAIWSAVIGLALWFVVGAYLSNQQTSPPFREAREETIKVDQTAVMENADSVPLEQKAADILSIISETPGIAEPVPIEPVLAKPVSMKPALVKSAAVKTEPLKSAPAKPVLAEPALKTSKPRVERDNRVSSAQLNALIGHFIDTYERGDLHGFMALFSEQVRTDNGFGKSGLRGDYGTLFYTSKSRHMRLNNMRWQRRGKFIRGHGNFVARVRSRGQEYIKHYTGTIRFELENQEHGLLIRGLYYAMDQPTAKTTFKMPPDNR